MEMISVFFYWLEKMSNSAGILNISLDFRFSKLFEYASVWPLVQEFWPKILQKRPSDCTESC